MDERLEKAIADGVLERERLTKAYYESIDEWVKVGLFEMIKERTICGYNELTIDKYEAPHPPEGLPHRMTSEGLKRILQSAEGIVGLEAKAFYHDRRQGPHGRPLPPNSPIEFLSIKWGNV